ncbi:MAG: NPCBM/NEW2 domain-containing protein, partial [Verrucomicrobiota bacterium]
AIEVRADRVIRIVAAPPAHPREAPGTLWFRDGRHMKIKAGRWRAGGVRALTSKGIETIPLTAIREWHRAKVDRIGALRVPGEGRWVRFETIGGAVVTTRESRMVRHHSKTFFVQPDWSYDGLNLSFDQVMSAAYRPFDEVPLSLLPAETLEEKSYTGAVWPWRRNRNVQGGRLQTGDWVSLMGIGAHAYSSIAFILPPDAETFTANLGLDRDVGEGGCVRCRIHLDDVEGPPLWESSFLTGSSGMVEVGPLSVRGGQRLILVTDFGHDDRPAGADPFDIRDQVNWLNPVMTCRPTSEPPVPPLAERQPFFGDWDLSEVEPKVNLTSVWNTHRGRWTPALQVAHQDLPRYR